MPNREHAYQLQSPSGDTCEARQPDRRGRLARWRLGQICFGFNNLFSDPRAASHVPLEVPVHARDAFPSYSLPIRVNCLQGVVKRVSKNFFAPFFLARTHQAQHNRRRAVPSFHQIKVIRSRGVFRIMYTAVA
jgi:hypothetical protein